jgi:hypothetical protein
VADEDAAGVGAFVGVAEFHGDGGGAGSAADGDAADEPALPAVELVDGHELVVEGRSAGAGVEPFDVLVAGSAADD